MKSLDAEQLSERDSYKLLIGSILPRPIALVTTITANGTVNAGPFSYFNIVTANPPLISVSVQRKQGEMKDTARNAVESGEFVVHISDETYVDQMNRTAANLGPEESEIELAGLTAVASSRVAVPGIAEARIRMECVLEQTIPLGEKEGAPACDLLIGRIVYFHVDEELYDNGRIKVEALKPVSRLAGSDYAKLGETFSLERPN
ncbi:flavin reductase family protein [Paenibacillus harenae]|uniref:Flavin reductase (DIM6/NTAB) family NADH-FMN oxidoreductase RutF n=1 Tax=Paenibacillus harenae TaxID=306543 RepID=A0ABT9U1B2_PAEHA|nr:flavin reductase family protein [Paenibacillus harenae]MDQ0113417.1 flavin reductase (DIM6/NTAB) family NADH-FMN oxidoreductase RutF [Paenibacillus harenae]